MSEERRRDERTSETRKRAQVRAMVAIAEDGSSAFLARPSMLPEMVTRMAVTSHATVRPHLAIISRHQKHPSLMQKPCQEQSRRVVVIRMGSGTRD